MGSDFALNSLQKYLYYHISDVSKINFHPRDRCLRKYTYHSKSQFCWFMLIKVFITQLSWFPFRNVFCRSTSPA